MDVLNRVRSPFNTSLAAQAAGIGALSEPGWVEAGLRHNTEQRAILSAALEAAGIRVWPSEGNFVLADFGQPAAAAAADAALRAHGVIVRAMGGDGLPHCLRTASARRRNARRSPPSSPRTWPAGSPSMP